MNMKDRAEIGEILIGIANTGRLPRHADVFLAGICAEHLVDELRTAGLVVVRPVDWRLHR
jgi:hypothetical protein